MPMKKVIALIVLNLLLAAVFMAGVLAGFSRMATLKAEHKQQPPTGYEVLNALNTYRKESGFPEFTLSESLCNNIGERWQVYKVTNSHEGFWEFAQKYHPGVKMAEILAPGATAQETVDNWKKSPSHDLEIKTYSQVCVYSADGLSVALLSN